MAQRPDVARSAMEIAVDPSRAYALSAKGNRIAVITDASAVLGLGGIGPYGALPVLEERAARCRELADIDAVPIALDTQDDDEIVACVSHIAPAFAAIALCDIAPPRCFEIEGRLQERLPIPVMLADRSGAACVALAELMSGAGRAGRPLQQMCVVVADGGSAGMTTVELLIAAGVADPIVVDRRGAIVRQDRYGSTYARWVAERTNRDNRAGSMAELMADADAFISLAPPLVLVEPEPVVPDFEAPAAAFDELLAYPGIFRGALDARATRISTRMKLAAAEAIAALTETVPPHLDRRVVAEVAGRVKFESEAFE
jgi:malate dehydrogenase (oxaloacetate-decarboxylating)